MDRTARDYEVCLCFGTTRGEVEDFIKNTGIKTLKELCEQMGIGNKCGGCREDLEMILNDMLHAPAE